MYEAYLSPQVEIDELEAEAMEIAAAALMPFTTHQHEAFTDFTNGCKPFVLLLGVYNRLDKVLDVLANYRSMVVEMVEDFDDVGTYAVQMSETIKACESILEQITFAAANVYKIDADVLTNERYQEKILEKARMLIARDHQHHEESAQSVQLELQL